MISIFLAPESVHPFLSLFLGLTNDTEFPGTDAALSSPDVCAQIDHRRLRRKRLGQEKAQGHVTWGQLAEVDWRGENSRETGTSTVFSQFNGLI